MNKSKLLRARTHARTVVTLLSGDTYEGLMISFDGTVLQLYEASMIGTAGTSIERAGVDGALFLPWVQVAYIQCP